MTQKFEKKLGNASADKVVKRMNMDSDVTGPSQIYVPFRLICQIFDQNVEKLRPQRNWCDSWLTNIRSTCSMFNRTWDTKKNTKIYKGTHISPRSALTYTQSAVPYQQPTLWWENLAYVLLARCHQIFFYHINRLFNTLAWLLINRESDFVVLQIEYFFFALGARKRSRNFVTRVKCRSRRSTIFAIFWWMACAKVFQRSGLQFTGWPRRLVCLYATHYL